MKIAAIATVSLITLAPLYALAETHEVEMLNRGETGVMVFEPRFVKAEVGDVVRFIPTDNSHNAESINETLPGGQEPFKGRINEEINVEMTAEGIVSVKCLPHFAMGMVMMVQVGEGSTVPEDFFDTRYPGKSKQVFEDIIEENLTPE